MSKELEFKSFCFEVYKSAKNLTGRKAMDIFKKYNVLDYLDSCYDVLHTTGKAYIIEDIDLFLKARNVII